MSLSVVVFYAFALLTVGSAAAVAFSSNIVYSAFALMGTLFTAVGILLSVVSRSQVEAALLSLGVLLFFFIIGPETMQSSAGWSAHVVDAFSVLARFDDFTRGILDLGHVAFFSGLTLLVLAAALRCLDLVRWQG